MDNVQKLEKLFTDIFLLEPGEFCISLRRDQINTWDSLGLVSLAVGIEETFGYHMAPDEALALTSIEDVMTLLKRRGISFESSGG